MVRTGSGKSGGVRPGSRSLVFAVGFGLFILFDIALFVWLIMDALAER